jgi:hypothetical protein
MENNLRHHNNVNLLVFQGQRIETRSNVTSPNSGKGETIIADDRNKNPAESITKNCRRIC